MTNISRILLKHTDFSVWLEKPVLTVCDTWVSLHIQVCNTNPLRLLTVITLQLQCDCIHVLDVELNMIFVCVACIVMCVYTYNYNIMFAVPDAMRMNVAQWRGVRCGSKKCDRSLCAVQAKRQPEPIWRLEWVGDLEHCDFFLVNVVTCLFFAFAVLATHCGCFAFHSAETRV